MSEIEVCFLDEILLSRLLCPRYMKVMDERSHELGDKMNLTTNTSTNTNAQHSGSACAMTCNQCTCITTNFHFLLSVALYGSRILVYILLLLSPLTYQVAYLGFVVIHLTPVPINIMAVHAVNDILKPTV